MREIEYRVAQIERHAPEYATRARDAYEHLEKGLRELEDSGLPAFREVDLRARRRKYQPISPEQFDEFMAVISALLAPWTELVSSPEFVQSVKQHNKVVRAMNAQRQQAALDQIRDRDKRLSEFLAMTDQENEQRLSSLKGEEAERRQQK